MVELFLHNSVLSTLLLVSKPCIEMRLFRGGQTKVSIGGIGNTDKEREAIEIVNNTWVQLLFPIKIIWTITGHKSLLFDSAFSLETI